MLCTDLVLSERVVVIRGIDPCVNLENRFVQYLCLMNFAQIEYLRLS